MSRSLRRWLLLWLLASFHNALTAQGKLEAADDVLDMMDMVHGWVSPHMRLD